MLESEAFRSNFSMTSREYSKLKHLQLDRAMLFLRACELQSLLPDSLTTTRKRQDTICNVWRPGSFPRTMSVSLWIPTLSIDFISQPVRKVWIARLIGGSPKITLGQLWPLSCSIFKFEFIGCGYLVVDWLLKSLNPIEVTHFARKGLPN